MNDVASEREFWDSAADDPDVQVNWICDPAFSTADCLEAVLKDYKGKPETIVEIGCGVGRLAIPMADRMLDSIVIGVDVSQRMIDLARANVGRQENIVFVKGTGRTIGLEVADFIYSTFVFQHLSSSAVSSYLTDVWSCLSSDGVFRFQFVEGETQAPFHYQYSEDTMVSMIENAGLQIESIETLLHDQWRWVTVTKWKL